MLERTQHYVVVPSHPTEAGDEHARSLRSPGFMAHHLLNAKVLVVFCAAEVLVLLIVAILWAILLGLTKGRMGSYEHGFCTDLGSFLSNSKLAIKVSVLTADRKCQRVHQHQQRTVPWRNSLR